MEREWLRDLERMSGKLTIRFECPLSGGPHARPDCPHVIDRAA